MDWTIVLSGPLNTRGPLLKALERAAAGMHDMPDEAFPAHGLDASDPTVGWVTVLHADVDQVTEIAVKHKYGLRMHWPTPACKACSGHAVRDGKPCAHCRGVGKINRKPLVVSPLQAALDEIRELRGRVAVLEGTAR